MSNGPAASATCGETCFRERHFAPTRMPDPVVDQAAINASTANRFSILADLDQSLTQSMWTFDFIPSSNSASRRREKRAGKHGKIKREARKRHKSQNSDSRGGVNEKGAALGKAAESPKATYPRTGVPQGIFTFSSDAVRHRQMSRFRSNPDALTSFAALELPTSKQAPLQLSQHCLVDGRASLPGEKAETGSRKPGFLPLSRNLAGPPTAVEGVTPARSIRAALMKDRPAERPLPGRLPLPVEEAAAAACRALASHAAISTASPRRLGAQISRSSNHTPLAQPPHSAHRPISSKVVPSMSTPSTPLAITLARITRPGLSTTLSSKSPPVIVPAIPFLEPFRPPPQPRLPTPGNRSLASALSIITAPMAFRTPLIIPSKSTATTVASSCSAQLKPAVSNIPGQRMGNEAMPILRVAQTELQDFLKMGHSNSCWCMQSSSTTCCSTSPTLAPPPPCHRLPVLRKRKFDESELAASALSPSLSSASSISYFEDLKYYACDATIRRSDDEQEDEEWTVVTPASTAVQSTSEPDSLVPYPSPPLTPRDPSTPPPSAAYTPPEQAEPRTRDDGRSDQHKPAPLHGFGFSRTQSPWAPALQTAVNLHTCAACVGCGCACATGATSAVEWPTLQAARLMRRTRRDKSGARDGAIDGSFWDGIVDWVIEGVESSH